MGLLHFGLVALSLASFAAALILCFATGNVLAPQAVWLLRALIAALKRETRQAPFTLIACEPNRAYLLCKLTNVVFVRVHDAPTGEQTLPAQSASFRAQLENEFISLGGLFVPCCSTYTGLALPTIGGVMPQAMPCFFLNATLQGCARRKKANPLAWRPESPKKHDAS